ncbi:MAG: hypothetical protein LBF78_12545, partial [Treponema sp.]|nr:hypothetical protein [Treponema sp.]
FNAIRDIFDGLTRTKKKEEWGFGIWPFGDGGLFTTFSEPDNYESVGYGRLDEKGIYTFYKTFPMKIVLLNEQYNSIDSVQFQAKVETGKATGLLPHIVNGEYNRKRKLFFSDSHIDPRETVIEIHFNNVKANDITDHLVIKIESVNGVETDAEEGNIKITTGNFVKPREYWIFKNK